jgi:hypothetical protein
MRWPPWRRRRQPHHETGQATRAKEESSRRLADAMRGRREVDEARDHLAQLIQDALRGTR